MYPLDQKKPFVSLLAPAYNEAAIIEDSVQRLYTYMEGLEEEYDWELVIVNDGSKDGTKELADKLASERSNMRAIHHKTNRNLGGALQTGFRHVRGDYVIVLDLDLSYAPDHIERLMTEIIETDSDMVIASPYMKGGKNTAVPFQRLLLSRVVNKIMALTVRKDIHTFTSMVRVYKRDLLENLNLKSNTYSIMPEIIHKALILRAKIREIPAHLDWSFQEKAAGRTSSIRIFKGILAGMMTSFIFRPYAFFMSVGFGLFLVALYMITWIFINTFGVYPEIAASASGVENAFTMAVAEVFHQRPYSFIVGGICLIISLQFLSLGFLSLQNKRYFDELFHLGTTNLRKNNQALQQEHNREKDLTT